MYSGFSSSMGRPGSEGLKRIDPRFFNKIGTPLKIRRQRGELDREGFPRNSFEQLRRSTAKVRRIALNSPFRASIPNCDISAIEGPSPDVQGEKVLAFPDAFISLPERDDL